MARALRRLLAPVVLLALAAPAAADSPPGTAPTAEQQAEIARLEALGYAAGTGSDAGTGGVVAYDAERAFAGVNLLVSGHGPEAVLTDMHGNVLHRWSRRFDQIWPGRKKRLRDSTSGAHYFRRAFPQPDGDLLVIFEGLGIARLDRRSELVWKKAYRAHHDLRVLPNGDVAVLTRRASVIPRIDPAKPTLEDFVSILGPGGEEKRRVSVLDAFLASDYAWMIEHRAVRSGDVLHTNSIEVLDGRAAARNAAFAPGRALVSVRELDAIAVLDLARGEVVWALRGGFRRQHDARIVGDGRLLLFDNDGLGLESRVLELDVSDGRTIWSHRGPESAPFYSDCCGTSRRLPNGNTLVTETTRGRAFEVTSTGDVVWELQNPFRIRVSESDPRRVTARLFDLIRLPPEFGSAWISAEPH